MTPLSKILSQLEFRGPTGKPLGHVVLTREEAQQLLTNIGVPLTDTQVYPNKPKSEPKPPFTEDLYANS